MNSRFDQLTHKVTANPWLSISIITGVGIAASYFMRRSQSPFAKAEREMKKLIKEEKNSSSDFPKEVDLEPASE